MKLLEGKVALVTGATRGIGRAIALRFAEQGANVAFTYLSSASAAESLVAEIEALGVRAVAFASNAADFAGAHKVVEQVVAEFGQIDILVNNAGISMRAVFKDMDLNVMRSLMDTNFWGTVYCTKYALPYLLESKGTVVGVISTAGYVGLPARTSYSASKFAVRGFLETLRIEHLYDGLNVLVFAPGFTASNIRNVALTADGSPQGETPRDEEKMMSAERVARILARGIMRKRAQMVLTPLGKATLFASRNLPRVTDRVEYRMMSNEPNSPLKKIK